MKIYRAKDRYFAGHIRLMMVEAFPELENDISVPPTSVLGSDLALTPKAQAILGAVFVCSHSRNVTVSSLLRQAQAHAEGTGLDHAAIFKDSYGVPQIAMRLSRWLRRAA